MAERRPPAPPGWEVSPQQVQELRARGADFVLLDCRTPDEHDLAAIEGDRLVPMLDLDLHLPELGDLKERPIVVYCHTGRRSLTVTAVLREHGFKDVRSMAGGIERWSLEIDPNVPRYERNER
ncbi:MAG: hypothetical protein L0Y44_05460 [Phycisphaerales bacterium]|nr:hypothetical protein [Phycisphaerales bacterium]MCI0630086.1 hypothetical protein [Phycisphaerales bacterium]MCI0675240.1 hypothetical protein [Phycisphaerales bacterium]